MNTPIIDPMLFYWMNILNNLAQLPPILILVLLVYFFGVLMYQDCVDYDERAAFKKKHQKALKRLLYITIVVSLLSLFIPTKETMLNMLIADQLTPANIHLIGDNLKDAVTFIAEQTIKVGKALK